jgi:hypothetical protein
MTWRVVACAFTSESSCGYSIKYFTSSNISYFKTGKVIICNKDKRF